MEHPIMNIQVYITNAGLGYQQYAYLIRLDESKNGYDYLCIDTFNIPEDNESYKLGEVVSDLEDIYIKETEWDTKNSPLMDTYLFNFFIENFNKKK